MNAQGPPQADLCADSGGVDERDVLVLLPEGWYAVTYRSHATELYRDSRPKLIINFSIESQDKHHGKIMPAYYNVADLVGPAGDGGRFKALPRGSFFRDFCAVVPGQHRTDRVPITRLTEFTIEGLVVTVRRDWDKLVIPDGALYSRIKRMRPLNR